jgi:TRAP-type C4-dicarboxylate transport system substrate-binding protein
MKKKLLLIPIALLLALSMIAISCPAEPEVIKLDFASITPAEAPISQTYAQWAEMINERSEGRVEITCYFGASLLKHEEMLRGVPEGVADIAFYAPSEDPGNWGLNTFFELPFLGYKSNAQATAIYNELLSNKELGLWDEFEDYGLVPYHAKMSPPFALITTDTAVRAPADIAGVKCYTLGKLAQVVSEAGGAPVSMDVTDVYMALDRGLIEGVFTHLPAMVIWGFLEHANYLTLFGEGGCYMYIFAFIINADVWNSLPPDIQQIFKDLEPWLDENVTTGDLMMIEGAKGILQEKGATILELTPAEMTGWEELALPLRDEWITEMEAAGKGEQERALMDEFDRLLMAD